MNAARRTLAGTLRGLAAVCLLALPVASSTAASLPRSLRGTVVVVTDGDTLKVLTPAQGQITIRLGEIDAPESGQPYGDRSRQELARLTLGKRITIKPTTTDRYGRTVARLSVHGRDVSAQMLRRGAAWVFVRYSSDPRLPPIEGVARASHIGLWRLPPDQRIPPWEWREAFRGRHRGHFASKANVLPSPSETPSGAFSCAAKRYCSEMTSCNEAVYHLRICGQKRLDRDGDGKPCERLCR